MTIPYITAGGEVGSAGTEGPACYPVLAVQDVFRLTGKRIPDPDGLVVAPKGKAARTSSQPPVGQFDRLAVALEGETPVPELVPECGFRG